MRSNVAIFIDLSTSTQCCPAPLPVTEFRLNKMLSYRRETALQGAL